MPGLGVPHIAVLVPDPTIGGGIPLVARFLQRTIEESGRYRATVISLAASARDKASLRLLAPATWRHGIRVIDGDWHGHPCRHVGAFLPEFEVQRYRARRVLTRVLDEFDLIQIVAGTPAVALSVKNVRKPACLFVATTSQRERVSMLSRQTGPRRSWHRVMTLANTEIERRVLPGMAHIFAESEYTRQLLTGIVPEERLSIGAPGVDTELFRPLTGERRDSGDYILAVGRFADPRKNVRLLFAAYRRLRERRADAPRLVLAGKTPPTREDWLVAESLGIAPWVEMRQDVGVVDLAELYRRALLFVLSSDEEGLGVVILEAMASGLPVISTRCGGPETAVIGGETGFLTPVGDAVALAERMEVLLQDPARRAAFGMNGRRIAESRFSLAEAGKNYLERYDELLSDSRVRSGRPGQHV